MSWNRRELGKNLAAVGITSVLGASRPAGANDRIGLGIIGCGNKGQSLWKAFLAQPDVEPVAVCDVYRPYLEKGLEMAGGRARGHHDFRKLLEDPAVDAVVIATPDHWHALQTVAACRAGKDIYVEKPLSLFVAEGRTMVNEARRHKRVVQTGSQQRSGAHYKRALELVRGGHIGQVHKVDAGFTRNVGPGFDAKDLPVDAANLDWDLWLGPAPKVALDPFRCLYHFRWFWDYSGGQMTNFGAHHLDIVRWVLDAPGPTSVAGFGGRFAVKDGGETPDVQEVIYQFPNTVVSWSTREINRGKDNFDILFYGTKGTLGLSRGGFEVLPESDDGKALTAALKEEGSDLTSSHVRNFLDCVKSREKPNADIEEGHRSATMCHLGNIATRLGRSLSWDAQAERIRGDAAANRWLRRRYRAPWSFAKV